MLSSCPITRQRCQRTCNASCNLEALRQPARRDRVAPRILFRPLLTSGLIGKSDAGHTYILIDSEQPEAEQLVALWHEALHLLGLTDEDLVEIMARHLAECCPEVLEAVKAAHAQ